MHDKLHAARFVKEALQHQSLLRWDRPERAVNRDKIVGQLLCAGRGQAGLRFEQIDEGAFRRVPFCSSVLRIFSSTSNRSRETASDNSSVRPGASPSQKGIPGGWPWASSTRTMPEFTENTPRSVAELKDVARHALDGEIFVDRSDECLGRFQTTVVGIICDCASRGKRGQARRARDAFIDDVTMNQRAAPTTLGAKAFGQHPHDVIIFVSVSVR